MAKKWATRLCRDGWKPYLYGVNVYRPIGHHRSNDSDSYTPQDVTMILILYSVLSGSIKEQPVFDDLLHQVPAALQEKVMRYRRTEDRYRCLAGQLLLKKGCQQLGLSSDHTLEKLQYTSYNRPFFANSSVDFNVSHSGRYIILAMSTSCRVGIDVEQVQPLAMDDLTGQMSAAEWESVFSAEDPLRRFYHFWTRKESVIKAVGKGLGIPLNSFSTIDHRVRVEGMEWLLREVNLSRDYVCHLATDVHGKDAEIDIAEHVL